MRSTSGLRICMYICDNLMYIICLCYFPLIHKLYFRFQYYFCLYFFYFDQALLILFIQLLPYTTYHTHTFLIPRKFVLLKSVLFIIIWFLRQSNFSFDCHLKCLTE